MLKTLLVLFFLFFLQFFATSTVLAQNSQQYSRGVVKEIVEETAIQNGENTYYFQELNIQTSSGENVKIMFGSNEQPLESDQRLKVGQQVIVVSQQTADGRTETVIADKWRVPVIWWLLIPFFLLVIVVARRQGIFSIFGMVASLGILLHFIIPQLLQGANPLFIAIIGVIGISVVTMYLTHGWKTDSHLALGSILATMVVVGVLSTLAVRSAGLTGLGDENAYYLQFSTDTKLNLQGLLLGGILLGALGVLDDICVAQVSVVRQLLFTKKEIPFPELYQRAMAVGKHHVASLVNTLVLAYAGANLPLFLLFTLHREVPLWVTLNQEIIIEEVIRTLAGSIGLVLAVPLTTVIAAWVLYGKRNRS